MTAQRLIIGTRGSLLALAQARQIAELIRGRHRSVAVDILPIHTTGDQDLRTPLDQVKDPGFFSDQLDEALAAGRVDLVVHSLKDLPPERPPAIAQAALVARDNPRDVVLFHPRVDTKLARGEEIRIGSCSVRRRQASEAFLPQALPYRGRAPRLTFTDLRGSVENRVAQIYQGADSLDGAILALAGLNRLWLDPAGRRRLAPLIESSRMIVLPLTECPTAPGQGVLAVECRKADARTRGLLEGLDSLTVRRAVDREFSFWRSRGYALEVGVTAESHPALGDLLFAADESKVELPPKPPGALPFDGMKLFKQRRSLPLSLPNKSGSPLFLAHWAALPINHEPPPGTRIWVSGVTSWKQIAARGLWVEGCGEHLGFEFLTRTLSAPALRLPKLAEWTVLTHSDAVASWQDLGIGQALASYELVEPDAPAAIAQSVARASHFFWGSPQQFDRARPWLPESAHHACGPGKTAAYLQAHGVEGLTLFPSRREWQQWLA